MTAKPNPTASYALAPLSWVAEEICSTTPIRERCTGLAGCWRADHIRVARCLRVRERVVRGLTLRCVLRDAQPR